MWLFGMIKRMLKAIIYLVLVIVIVALIPNLPPYTKFSSIEIEPALPREGPLKPNGILNNAQKLYKDKLVGPEAFQLYNGEVYTSLESGEVVKLSPGGHVTFVTKLGQPCQGLNQEQKCGRPLGLAIDEKTGKMYVADAYYGIWKVDIKTDKKQLLVSPRVDIDGRKPMLFNSVVLAKNGDLYWTDSSSDFHLNKGAKTVLADPSGRLLHYNAATNKSKVLLDDLWFSNGVAVSPDNQFVVVAETSRYRLLKYYVAGPRRGQAEVLVAGLPGTPDNIQTLPDGSGMLVGLYVAFDDETPVLSKSLAKTPIVRKFLARMLTLVELPIEFLNNQFPNAVFEKIAHNLASFKSLAAFLPPSSGLLVVDWNGNIIESYYNTDGSLKHVSDAIVYRDQLYLGSPHSQDYVGAVPAPPLLKKAYSSVNTTPPPKTAETVTKPVPRTDKTEAPQVAKPVEQTTTTPKPTTTTPKPTTTTPKPTTTTPKPTTTTPKPTTTTPKPTTTTPKPTTTTPKPTTTTPKPTTTTPKPTTTTPKPTTTTSKPTTTTPKPTTTTPKPATTTKPVKQPEQQNAAPKKAEPNVDKQKQEKAVKKEEIPIREEIPSDTVKPTKENLKVIKKGGPTEIPNPEL